MTDKIQSLDQTVENLSQRVDEMSLAMEKMAKHLDVPEKLWAPHLFALGANSKSAGQHQANPTDNVLKWLGASSALQRLSTLCFVLVVALALRTITDKSVVSPFIGTILGLLYTSIIIAIGWRKYAQSSVLAPVFAASGSLLMISIVAETHSHFMALAQTPAYIILALTGITTFLISRSFKTPIPASAGLLGICAAGILMDFPHPYFPASVLLVLLASVLATFVSEIKKCSWLKWVCLPVALGMFATWTLNLVKFIIYKQQIQENLAQNLLIPVLVIFTLGFLFVSLIAIIRKKDSHPAIFFILLPSITAVWGFAIAYSYSVSTQSNLVFFGAIGFLYGLLHIGVGTSLALQKKPLAFANSKINSFIFAGTILVAAGLPLLLGSFLLSLPGISAIALALAIIANRWKSGSVRATAYLLQLYCVFSFAFLLSINAPGHLPLHSAICSTSIALFSILQYRASTIKFVEDPDNILRNAKTTMNRFAVVLLIASVTGMFFAIRVAAFQILSSMLPNAANAFSCTQSIIINVAALGLMTISFALKDRELRNVAILFIIIGTVKVFFLDLFRTHGTSLVIDVFLFGLAVAIESAFLSKWQRYGAAEKARER